MTRPLADQGDGFYSYIDTFEEAERLFVEDLTPTLTVVAQDAKAQVAFDEDKVQQYRLVGYENRKLDDSDFTDDSVDAGELGAGHQVSALKGSEAARDRGLTLSQLQAEADDLTAAKVAGAQEIRTVIQEAVEAKAPRPDGDG